MITVFAASGSKSVARVRAKKKKQCVFGINY